MSPRGRHKRNDDSNKSGNGSNKSENGSNKSGDGSDVQQLSNVLVLKYLEEEGFSEIHDQFLQVISKQTGKYSGGSNTDCSKTEPFIVPI